MCRLPVKQLAKSPGILKSAALGLKTPRPIKKQRWLFRLCPLFFMRPQETWREACSHYWRPNPCGRFPSFGAPCGIAIIQLFRRVSHKGAPFLDIGSRPCSDKHLGHFSALLGKRLKRSPTLTSWARYNGFTGLSSLNAFGLPMHSRAYIRLLVNAYPIGSLVCSLWKFLAPA